MKDKIKSLIHSALQAEGINEDVAFVIEHPGDLSHGDYSTNVSLLCVKKTSKNPVAFAVGLAAHMEKTLPEEILKVEVAGPGFINFHLSPEFFAGTIKEISEKGKEFGKNPSYNGKKVAVEYTDPNPFKQFHIGHLMTNAIGEAVARLFEWNGAEVKRFCYQGDVGRHVALALWGMKFMDEAFPTDDAPLRDKTEYLGQAYALGAKKIKEDPTLESEVQGINKKIYCRSDEKINETYEKGRKWSLDHFQEIYEILGTKFDSYFFESQTAPVGLELVRQNIPNVFRESEGAVIFPGEEHDLHTRVFITKENLPTYEAKDFGLAKMKYEAYPADISIIMTGNEQNDYFKVLKTALMMVFPHIASITSHISHGMLRFASGKMSSREGNVITGESLINDMIEASNEKMKERELSADEKKKIAEQVAVGALKYTILRQSLGKDIIFDKEKSLSFEGDSGPYLQYAHTRAVSILRKAKEEGIAAAFEPVDTELSKMLYRLPEIIEESLALRAPHQLVTYLTEITSLFNGFYANTVIVSKKEPLSASRIGLTHAFEAIMRNGLNALGIPVPEKM